MRHSSWISIAAVENLQIQIHASLHIIQPYSRKLVQELIAMRLTMAPALSLAKHMNTILFSVPTATGTHQILHLLLHQLDSPIGSITRSLPRQIFYYPFQRQSFSWFSLLLSWHL